MNLVSCIVNSISQYVSGRLSELCHRDSVLCLHPLSSISRPKPFEDIPGQWASSESISFRPLSGNILPLLNVLIVPI